MRQCEWEAKIMRQCDAKSGSCADPDFMYSIAQIYKASYKRLLFQSMAACERIMEKDLGKAATAVIVELLKQEVDRGE